MSSPPLRRGSVFRRWTFPEDVPLGLAVSPKSQCGSSHSNWKDIPPCESSEVVGPVLGELPRSVEQERIELERHRGMWGPTSWTLEVVVPNPSLPSNEP